MNFGNTLCRICLLKTGTISLFDSVNEIQYSTKLMKCVRITISRDDALPDSICECCVSELNLAFEFIQKCEHSDKALQCLINKTAESRYQNQQSSSTFNIEIKEELDVQCDNLLDDYSLTENISNIEDHDHLLSPESLRENESVQEPATNKKTAKKRVKLGPVRCEQCGLLTMSPSALANHIRTHTGEKPFNCSFCNSQFRTNGSLKRHILAKHSEKREKKFTCETCGTSFYSKSAIIIHIRLHTNEKPYLCPYCPKRFSQLTSLIRHKRVHTGERPYSCQVCGKSFNDKELVKKHQSVHTNERNFNCHICHKSYKSKSILKTHLSLHSNEICKVCNYCGKSFSTRGNLLYHIRQAHTEKSGHCSICFKSFPDLEMHMNKHNGMKPFVCKLCDKSFAAQRNLSHHIGSKHNNVSKFKCTVPECDQSFSTAYKVKYHLVKHHNKNGAPHICQHCSRGFFRLSDLTRHIRMNHLEEQMKVIL